MPIVRRYKDSLVHCKPCQTTQNNDEQDLQSPPPARYLHDHRSRVLSKLMVAWKVSKAYLEFSHIINANPDRFVNQIVGYGSDYEDVQQAESFDDDFASCESAKSNDSYNCVSCRE